MFQRWISLFKENQLVIGPRRSGKTTLLHSRFPDLRYTTLDDLDNLQWAIRDGKGFIESMLPSAVIDEIQRVPALTIAVKYAIDNQNFTAVMTGSSSIGLLDTAADTLAGRIAIRRFPTACWGEEAGPPTHSLFDDQLSPQMIADARRKLERQIQFGGFPEVIAASEDAHKLSILGNYRDTYFTRDLAQLSNIENIEGLLAILQHAGRSIGSHLEISNFARESGLSHPTAKKYIRVLLQSDLAFKLYGYQYGPAKRYQKASKLYFADNGVLKGMRLSLSSGQLLENFVISELEKRRKLGFICSDQFYYYKSTGGAEIDLIFEQGDELIIVEVKSVKRPAVRDVRQLVEFKRETDVRRRFKRVRPFLLYLGDEYMEIEGVKCVPICALYRSK